jgi:hypothetical protein
MSKSKLQNLLLLFVATTIASCATIGQDFPSSEVPNIKIGKSTQNDIQAKFGFPWRVGLEDGHRTWTYGIYHYSAFTPTTTRDLIIRFDAGNVVKSYSFNSTDMKDVK